MKRAALSAGAVHTARFPWRMFAVGIAAAGAAIAVFLATEARVAGELLLIAMIVATGRVLYLG